MNNKKTYNGSYNGPYSPKHVGSSSLHTSPRVRTEHSGYDPYKINGPDDSAYSRVASGSYLQSSAIKGAKRRRFQRKLVIALIAVFSVALIAAGAAFAYVSGISNKLGEGIDESLFGTLVQTDTPEDPFNVLLLGTDKSEAREKSGEFDGTFRSDSIMVARIDPQQKKAAIVSIPRDTQVDLGSHGIGKINAARAYGGPTLAVTTVSELTGLPISHYAEIDFDGFAKIVDAVGGIEVNVPIDIDDKRAGGSLSAGKQTLNGKQALILCRSRHSYDNYGAGDLYRAANQRLVLSAIANKLLASDVVTIASSVQSLADSVATDMKAEEIISVASSMIGLNSATDIYTAVMPTTSEYINGGWYEIMDEEEWEGMAARMSAGESPALEDSVDKATGTILASSGGGATEQEAVLVDITGQIALRNGCGTDGVGRDALNILKKMGYPEDNIDVKNANSQDFKETIIVYKEDDKAKYAQGMAKKLKAGKAIKDDGSYLFETDYLIVIGSDWKI